MCRLSFGGLYAAFDSYQNKRTKHESSGYSGASFDTHSNMVEVLQGKEPALLKTDFVVTSPLNRYILAEQGTSAEELGAAEVDTSFWSSDNENTVDDDYSRCDTSTFSSSEEGFTQRPQCCDPFLHSGRHISANKQFQYQRDDSWSGGSNFLQSQLGCFIHKEKLKLDSEFEEGYSGSSRRLLRGSVCGYGSIEPVASILDDRLLGSSGSLSGFLGATNSVAQRGENTGYHGEIYSSRTSCMLLSYVGNRKMNGFEISIEKDEMSSRSHFNVFTETEEQVFLTNSVQGVSWPPFSSAQLEELVHASGSPELRQKFVLSSGRLNNVTGILIVSLLKGLQYIEFMSYSRMPCPAATYILGVVACKYCLKAWLFARRCL